MTKTNLEMLNIAASTKAAVRFATDTVKSYVGVNTRLHQAAVIGLFHALQHRECAAINALLTGLRDSDAALFRAWIARVTLTPGKSNRNPGEDAATLIGYSKDKGLYIRKGLISEDAWAFDDLLASPSFLIKAKADKPDATLAQLIAAFAAAAKSLESKADKAGLELPDTIQNLVNQVTKVTEKAKRAIDAGNDNSNVVDKAKAAPKAKAEPKAKAA